MTKIVSNFFITLDGVVEAPHEWHFPYFTDEMGAAMDAFLEPCTAFLMGRVLYDEWASYWPSHADDDEFGPFINNIDKYVVSDSLDEATWAKTTVVSGDVAARLREIKHQTAGDIGISGSATLVRWLLTHDLLDELRLLVDPVVVGRGRRLFEDMPHHPLQLTGHEVFDNGVLNLAYAPAVR